MILFLFKIKIKIQPYSKAGSYQSSKFYVHNRDQEKDLD